jgi:hypothetical protein
MNGQKTEDAGKSGIFAKSYVPLDLNPELIYDDILLLLQVKTLTKGKREITLETNTSPV